MTGQDEAILGRVAQGDQQAFADLYDAWSSLLMALIMRIVVDRSFSEEVLQEVFLEIWQQAPTFDPAKGSARAWMVTMARRRAVDRVRSHAASRRRDTGWYGGFTPDHDSTAEEATSHVEGERLHRALAQLGEPYRSTLELAYFSGMTHTELASTLDAPLGTIKTRIRTGLSRLRALLEEE